MSSHDSVTQSELERQIWSNPKCHLKKKRNEINKTKTKSANPPHKMCEYFFYNIFYCHNVFRYSEHEKCKWEQTSIIICSVIPEIYRSFKKT